MPRRHKIPQPARFSAHASCEAKRRFASEAAALIALEEQELANDVSLRVYQCPYCGGWHLTSSK